MSGSDSSRQAFTFVADIAVPFVEGPPGQALIAEARDFNLIVEACFSHDARAAVVYAENLPASFFDLSSRDAGELLQKLQNYGIRLAVVCSPGAVTFSSRFGEMLDEIRRGTSFNILDTRANAVAWLQGSRS